MLRGLHSYSMQNYTGLPAENPLPSVDQRPTRCTRAGIHPFRKLAILSVAAGGAAIGLGGSQERKRDQGTSTTASQNQAAGYQSGSLIGYLVGQARSRPQACQGRIDPSMKLSLGRIHVLAGESSLGDLLGHFTDTR